MTGNPERLATLWRFLVDRDISDYRVAKAPPVSREKREAQVAGMTTPLDRHMAAALETLRVGRREFFTIKELADLMSAMADNEYANTNGEIDDRRTYDFGKNPSAIKRLKRDAVKIRELKTGGERETTVYGLRTASPAIDALASAGGIRGREALERDRERNRLSSDHPWPVFAGPLTPAGGSR